MPAISEAKILLIATDGFEDSELLETRRLLDEKGAGTVLASLEKKEIKGDKGDTAEPDCTVEEVGAADFDALVLPGGVQNPDKLRMNERVVALVREFVASGKPVAAICHGPWLLVEADAVRGRTVTSWPSIRTDLRNAGAEVVDRAAVTDGNIVTSRKPEDIPAFVEAVTALYEKADALEEA
ncbi:MAG: type 1 glutamine amidotransferase [Alphaproteobacteria bacterium]|nr:type 1 glutamine amidotransferase [Alphaproteobacteria bacterium]